MATEGHHFEETPHEREIHAVFNAFKDNPHFEGIEWNELKPEDIALLDKFAHGKLAESDILERTAVLDEEGRSRGDASVDLCAMLLNQIIIEHTKGRERELRENEQEGRV